MDEAVNRHKSLILSALYLLCGIFAVGYNLYYVKYVEYARQLQESSKSLEAANRVAVQKGATEGGEQEQLGLQNFPRFLGLINELAKDGTVIIDELTPVMKDGELSFNLRFIADYPTFLKFAAGLESLSVILSDLKINRYEESANPPRHAISFSLVPYNDGKRVANEQVKAMWALVNEKDKRNPFQRHAFYENKEVSKEIELTWVNKLQGIGTSPDGGKYATIDRMNYRVGEKFGKMTVMEIQADSVRLEQADAEGTKYYLLRFRDSKLDGGK